MSISTEEKDRYLRETAIVLAREGFQTGKTDTGKLRVLLDGAPLCEVTENGGITYRNEDINEPERVAAKDMVYEIVRNTAEYMRQMETAPFLKADGLEDGYKVLADFNGTVLAGTPSKHGVHFVTWDWAYGHTGVCHGHYFMDKKRLVDGTTALAEKRPRVIKIEPAERPQNVRLRVAAYTRVSSDSEDQLNSFAAQNRYYTELISGKAEWRMVDIYADEGITGTSVAKRDDFQRMMADCRRGLIDQILVKSISRFARNTKDCLQNIRELKELGVNVRFEREGIDTVNVSSELITAIYAAFAQKESESISGNRQWGYQRSMEQGTFNTYYAPVGFTLIDGNLQINQAEAPTIQRILTEYLSGNNSREIAAALNKDKALGRHWRREAIDYILQNERYAGNALLQKRYTTDSFPRKKKRNRGEREMYFVSGSNEAIISQEMFDQAQQLRKTRKREPMPLHDTISRQIRCSCGARVRAKKINQKWYWCCCNHEERHECQITPIPEIQVQESFCRLYYKLKHQSIPILEQMLTNLRLIRNRKMLWSPDIVALNKRISDLSSQNQTLAFLKQQGLVDPDIFTAPAGQAGKRKADGCRERHDRPANAKLNRHSGRRAGIPRQL